MATLSKLAGVSVTEVRGIGKDTEKALAKGGITTVADLLHHLPRTYVDRTDRPRLDRVPLGTEVTVIGEVKSIATRRPRAKFTITEARITDETATLKVVWFNQPFRERQLSPGTEAAFAGTIESYRGSLQMANPVVAVLDSDKEALHTGRIVPIYPQVGKVKPFELIDWVANALIRARPIPRSGARRRPRRQRSDVQGRGICRDSFSRHARADPSRTAATRLRRAPTSRSRTGAAQAQTDRGGHWVRP